MYFLRTWNNRETLVEMTAKELKAALRNKAENEGYRMVDATAARRWVKDGGHHETPLYVDIEGRVRYARDGY